MMLPDQDDSARTVSGINWLHLYTLQESGGASSIFIYVMVLSSSYSPRANEDAEYLQYASVMITWRNSCHVL